jgi:hypothetical protein
MIIPLAASVALATAPTASAATPTTATFTHSAVSAGGHHSRGHHYRGHGHRGYYDREFYWNRNGYYPFAGPTFGGYGPVYNSFGLCKEYSGAYSYPYFLVPC